MRALVIKESDGLWTVETSSGVRSSGATLSSALSKVWPGGERPPDYVDFEKTLLPIFNSIRDSGGGQFVSGQASA